MAAFDDLLAEAKKLGIPTNSQAYKPKSEGWSELQITEWELHRRIKEERRHRREQKLWVVAVISAIAAVVSAIGAWLPAILHK
jgi:hypothetical protein